jgi:hypothetical protein
MVAYPRRSLILPLAPLGAGLALFLVVVAAALVPAAALEALSRASGLSALVGAAQPPLGWTARAVVAVVAGGAAAALAWAVLRLGVGRRRVRLAWPEPAPVRRADAHPDAPLPRPIMAGADLGRPLMEQPLPRDLDTPLAAVDPEAIPDVPLQPVRAVAPLARPAPTLAPGERMEVFALAPAPAPTPASVDALLERLERNADRQRPRARSAALEATLASLRQMATAR